MTKSNVFVIIRGLLSTVNATYNCPQSYNSRRVLQERISSMFYDFYLT